MTILSEALTTLKKGKRPPDHRRIQGEDKGSEAIP